MSTITKTTVSHKRRQAPRKRQPMNVVKQEGSINIMQPLDKPYTSCLRYNSSLVSDASGVVTARFSLRNPLRAFNGSGTYSDASNFGALFDEYKPLRWTMQYVPLLPVGSVGLGSFAMATDYDSDDTTTANYANISLYQEYKILDGRKAFEYVAKIPNLTQGVTGPLGSDPESAVIHSGGFLDYNAPPNNGVVFLGGIGFPANVNVGNFILTLVIVNRRKR